MKVPDGPCSTSISSLLQVIHCDVAMLQKRFQQLERASYKLGHEKTSRAWIWTSFVLKLGEAKTHWLDDNDMPRASERTNTHTPHTRFHSYLLQHGEKQPIYDTERNSPSATSSMWSLRGGGCDGRTSELHLRATTADLHDRRSNKQARGGALRAAATPASSTRRCCTSEPPLTRRCYRALHAGEPPLAQASKWCCAASVRCKYIFQVFQRFQTYVSSVLSKYFKSSSQYFICCNSYINMYQRCVEYVAYG
jgi:hypothetical protein